LVLIALASPIREKKITNQQLSTEVYSYNMILAACHLSLPQDEAPNMKSSSIENGQT